MLTALQTRLTRAFRNSSIQFKLSSLIVLSGSLAVILAGAGIIGFQGIQYREAATREVSALAGIMATSSTAALAFGDVRAENETLAALRGDPRQLQAAVYDEDKRLFATYERPGIQV